MFFKTLEIQGFKSFADKTVLNFDTQITAVVGSNGNGKSNISDALRWVMGEQGAKSLRGEKMEDVIFHGTVERKQMGFARVALTMDNTDRALDVDADEVVISRKLYRSGESEYLINGQRSRLKDIQELLMGTGLGRDGYSIIGQGRVADIVNSRGSQRREIFEEAAGISLFLHKKADAEKQLAAAEENITRQRDIIKMYEERLPTLRKQSEKALLFTELQGQRRELEISVSVAQMNAQKEDMRRLDDQLLLNRGECDNFESDIRRAQADIEQLAEDKNGAQGLLERHRRSIQAASAELAEKNAAIKVAENDLSHNDQRRTELSEQLRTAQESGREYEERTGAIAAQIEQGERTLAELSEKSALADEELAGFTKRSSEAGEEYAALESALAEACRRKNEADTAVKQAELARQTALTQKNVFLEGLADCETKLREYTEQSAQAQKSLAGLAEERDRQKNRLMGYQRISDGKRRRMNELKTALDELNEQLRDRQNRHRVLSDVERNMVGYNGGVKAVMTASSQGRLKGIHGIVANVISVGERYVQAIETVLQGTMQNVIVDDGEVATRCINFLRQTNAGRVTFYPLTTIKGRRLRENGLEAEDGVEGVASELVRCDETYAEIISNLLGTTVIVDDMFSANRIAKKYGYRFRIVTLDGQLINAGGSYTGGSRDTRFKMLSNKQEIDALWAEISELKKTAAEKNEAFAQYQAEISKADIEIDGMNDSLRALDNGEITLRAELRRLESLTEQLSQQGDAAKQTLAEFDAQAQRQQQIITENSALLEAAGAEIAALEEKTAAQGGVRKQAEERIRELSEQMSALNLEKLSVSKDIESLRAKAADIENTRRLLARNSSEFVTRMEELDNSDREIRERIERIRLEIEAGSGEVDEKNTEIDRLSAEVTAFEQKITERRRDIDEANAHKEKFSREVARLEERRASMQKEYDGIVDMLFKRYELIVSQAVELAKPLENLMAAENDLDGLKKRINALGTVNTDSIDEYQQVSELYEFQSAQLADIEKSKAELESVIEQLTGDIKTRFLHSFEEINGYFREIFVEIFGDGAHAELELTDPEDVLNSGIEINAAPPGKVIKNLISLSGGEQTMVAITIYLAILKHRPTPFCMLDEVDAALDDVNVEKYIRYLNQFSSQTQLMVISHRRGTIEGCKVLYGVFMQEKGVSRLLRKELTDELDVELK